MERGGLGGHDPALWIAVSSFAVYSHCRCSPLGYAEKGVSWLDHYIDDYVTMGSPDSPECVKNVAIMRVVFSESGLPTEPEKDEGPAIVISLLGMELDTEKLEIRLPQDKLQQLKAALGSWRAKKACRKRELLSLIGSLSHACKAVRAGWSFLHRLTNSPFHSHNAYKTSQQQTLSSPASGH